jgi:hypothetical protein
MADKLAQLEAVTNDYFMLDNGQAADNYFLTSFLLDYGLKQKKMLFKRPSGGEKIRVPVRFDGNTVGYYSRGDTIESTKREAITATYADWKHAYSNATILRIDELKNNSPEGLVDLTTEELYGAQESITELLAESIYDDSGGSAKIITGVRAVSNTDADVEFQGLTSNQVISDDGTQVWTGKGSSTETNISLDQIRTMKTAAAFGKGKMDEPDFMSTTQTLFNTIRNILQVQQRFTSEGSKPVKAGFTGVHFEGTDIFPDKFCPSGDAALINSKHWGWAVHSKGMFQRSPWEYIQGSARDKTLKIFFDGNTVADNRRAHYYHSNLV